ncbi:hypothetical protein CRE_14320 [Caenorhabditis remanei]|uniref:Uncharacterized protein n=1 Tax=Caenorhabditis remanei TaxID=31234 RepID=E3NEZ3_CAERE|nr:hypothetical protein CRE_14320 [Caenorhabditis remanei]
MWTRLATSQELDALEVAPELTLYQLDFLRRKGRFNSLQLEEEVQTKTIEEILKKNEFGGMYRKMADMRHWAGKSEGPLTFKDYLNLFRFRNRFEFVLGSVFREYYDEAIESERNAIQQKVSNTMQMIETAGKRLRELARVQLDERHSYIRKNITGTAKRLEKEVASCQALDAWKAYLESKSKVNVFEAFAYWTTEQKTDYQTSYRKLEYEMFKLNRLEDEVKTLYSLVKTVEGAALMRGNAKTGCK